MSHCSFVWSIRFIFCTVCPPRISPYNLSPYGLSNVRTIRLPYGLSAFPCYVIVHQSSCFEHFSLNNFIIRKLWQGRGGAATTSPRFSHLCSQNVSRAIFLIFKQLANNWQTIGKQLANNWKFIDQSNKGSS